MSLLEASTVGAGLLNIKNITIIYMTYYLRTTFSKYILCGVLIAVLLGGTMMVTTHKAQAASTSEIQTLIQELLAKIAVLQTLLQKQTGDLEGGYKGESFSIGDEVTTTNTLNVRSSAGSGSSLLSMLPAASKGTIVGGPITKDGYLWWNIKYSGVTGWSAHNWLHATGGYAEPTSPKEVEKTTEPITLSAKIISPISGTYKYGDSLTVKWSQTGEVPKGSTACVFLQSFTTYKEFLFEKCVDVAGVEPERSVTGVITRTSGYDLAPGNYRAKVRIIGPSSLDGKDGPILAVGKGAGTFTIKDETSNPTAGIANVTNEKNPLITGVASGVSEVTVSVASLSGDKVYGSGLIPVVNGQWSHRVTTDLTDGSYTFKTRIDGNVVHEFGATILVISDPNAVARFKAVLNGTVVKAITDATKQAASDACRVVYNDYSTYNFKYGDVLDCYWNGQKFLTINAWKG